MALALQQCVHTTSSPQHYARTGPVVPQSHHSSHPGVRGVVEVPTQ